MNLGIAPASFGSLSHSCRQQSWGWCLRKVGHSLVPRLSWDSRGSPRHKPIHRLQSQSQPDRGEPASEQPMDKCKNHKSQAGRQVTRGSSPAITSGWPLQYQTKSWDSPRVEMPQLPLTVPGSLSWGGILFQDST